MRIWLHLFFVVVSLSVAYSLRPTPPESELRRKAQTLVDQLYGRGHARVTVTQQRGRGHQTKTFSELGNKSLVVGLQKKHEAYRGKNEYVQDMTSEKLEVPQTITIREEENWVERTGVAVVVDVPPGQGVEKLLEAGLGLDTERGDKISVVHSRR